MHRTCNLLTALADPAFNLRAFADYTKSKTDAYTRINASIVSSLELLPDLEDDDDILLCPTDQVIETHLLEHGVESDAILLLNGGYTTPKDIVKSLLQNQIKIENGVILTPLADIPLSDPLRTTVRSVDWMTAVEDMQSSLMAAESLQAGIEGMIAKIEGFDLASVATKIENKLQGKVDLTNITVSSSVAYYKEVISTSMNENDFLRKILNITGVEDMADEVPLSTPMNSQISEMTGASPAGPLDFSNVIRGTKTVLSIGCKVVAGLVGAAVFAGKKLFSTVEQKVTQIVTDPYDLYEVDGSDSTFSPIVSNFGYVSSDRIIIDRLSASVYTEDDVINLVESMNQTFHNSLVISKFVFGELSINGGIFSYELHESWLLGDRWFIVVDNSNYTFKPKPIRAEFHDLIVSRLFSMREPKTFAGGRTGVQHLFPTSTDVQEADGQIAALAGEILSFNCKYYTVADNEVDLCNGFSYARNLLPLVLLAAVAEWNNEKCCIFEENATLETTVGMSAQSLYMNHFSNSVTNMDFVRSVSGYNYLNNTFDLSPVELNNNFELWGQGYWVTYDMNLSSAVSSYLYIFYHMKKYQMLSPASYPYFPYRRDVEQFSVGRYAIKTDAENAEAFNSFMTAVVVAVIVVAVVVSCGIIVRKISKSLWKRREISNARIQSKLWNGEKLTSREWRKNRRYARRAATVSAISSPFPSSLKDTVASEIMTAAGLQSESHSIESLDSSIAQLNMLCGNIRDSINLI